MKRYGREVDRLRALSRRLGSAATSTQNGHSSSSSTFPLKAEESRPPDTPPSARIRTLPDPPDDDPSIFGHERGDRRPRPHLRGRIDPGVTGGRVLILFGLIAALIAGGYFWVARPVPQAVPEPTGAPSLISAAATPAPTAQSGTVVVHVHGKVRRPGIVTLPGGSRVADAVKAAGGVRPGAGTGSLNLARKLIDGEQIPVGVRGATPSPVPSGSGGAGASGGAGGAVGPIDLNTATVDQLDQLPGVGPVLAQRIVDYRTQNGGFRSIEQLQEVSGIGSKRYDDLKSKVRV